LITFWLVNAVLVGIALAFVLPTLLERTKKQERSDSSPAGEANIDVYRDQLRELERDRANGLVGADQFEQDRDELERRLLDDVAATSVTSRSKGATRQGRGAAYAIALGLPIIAIVFYLRIGNPNATSNVVTASQPTAQGTTSEGEMSQERIEANVAALAKRQEQNPNDLQGWTMLGRSYTSLERYGDAANAYAKATALKPDDADLWADYAFVLAMSQGKKLEGEPSRLIDKALQLDPENPKALELAGSAAFEAKDYKRAIDYWEKLLKKVPANSELSQSLAERINDAKTRAGSR